MAEGSSPVSRVNPSKSAAQPTTQLAERIAEATGVIGDHDVITTQTAALLSPNANGGAIEKGWIAHFFRRYAAASEAMQSWWARLLVAEAADPGTFSQETIEFLAALNDKDAALFTAFCQFAWIQGEPTPLIYQVDNAIYTGQGIDLPALKRLQATGLISLAAGGYVKKGYGKHTRMFYHGQPTKIGFAGDANNQLELGHALLTGIGKELTLICGASRNQQFYEYVIRQWFRQGLVLSSILVGR